MAVCVKKINKNTKKKRMYSDLKGNVLIYMQARW